MGRRIQKNSANHEGSDGVQQTNHQTPRRHQKSQSQKQTDPPSNLGNILGKIIKRYAPVIKDTFKELPDHRQQIKITYQPPHLMWGGLLTMLLCLGSRKQFRQEKRTETFAKNLLKLSGTHENTIADPDTINNFLTQLPHQSLEDLSAKFLNHLIRIKALDFFRFKDMFLLAMDGTGMHKFNQRHCEHCLTSTHKTTGTTFYYHPILEAKLVLTNGFTLSVASEFIKNPSIYPTKQDCEIAAFKRLVPRIKQYFPRLGFCFLADALYANASVFQICQDLQWKYIINFKDGNLPAFYKQMWKIKQKKMDNRKTIHDKHITQTFAWVNRQEYQEKYLVNAIYCHEVNAKTKAVTDYAWITNIHNLNKKNVDYIANRGARLRWQIEECFNMQKNGGYELQHPYSFDNNARANWHSLMLIAHDLNQLMVHSNLFRNFKAQMGSFRNFVKRLAEHLRWLLIQPKSWLNQSFQIRLNSS